MVKDAFLEIECSFILSSRTTWYWRLSAGFPHSVLYLGHCWGGWRCVPALKLNFFKFSFWYLLRSWNKHHTPLVVQNTIENCFHPWNYFMYVSYFMTGNLCKKPSETVSLSFRKILLTNEKMCRKKSSELKKYFFWKLVSATKRRSKLCTWKKIYKSNRSLDCLGRCLS